ncbi:MAG: hypothetical protein ACKVOQ_07975 [Cyclobacteriaceae bacterium]|jgi:hypothetical protein
MKAIYLFLTVNQSKDEFVANRAIREIEAKLATQVKEFSDEPVVFKNRIGGAELSRIAKLEGYYKDGVEYSLSAN